MARADQRSTEHSFLPQHLYSSSALSLLSRTSAVKPRAPASIPALYDPFAKFRSNSTKNVGPSRSSATAAEGSNFMIPSVTEGRKMAMYSKKFYAVCTVGGILSGGLTHTGVTPLDVVKCNIQEKVHGRRSREQCRTAEGAAPTFCPLDADLHWAGDTPSLFTVLALT